MRSMMFLAIGLSLLVLHPQAWAGPGDLDPTFGSGGMTAPFTSYPFSLAYSPADGALITATGGTVRRFTAAGVLDVTFGSGGATTIPDIETGYGTWAAVIVDGTGRILVAGGSPVSNATWVVAR